MAKSCMNFNMKPLINSIAIADNNIIAYCRADNKVTVRDLNKNGEVLYEFQHEYRVYVYCYSG